jgi:hypothetical protein
MKSRRHDIMDGFSAFVLGRLWFIIIIIIIISSSSSSSSSSSRIESLIN